MDYVLGIDQGASKTAAVLMGTDGRVVACGRGKGELYVAGGLEAAADAVRAAATEALRAAAVGWDQVCATVAGMTGADWPEEYELLRNAVAAALPVRGLQVVNDCMIALRAGTESREAAVVCAGSGLNVGFRDADGREHIWGYYIDEEYQGASALSRRMVRAVVAAEAGVGPATLLTAHVLSAAGVDTVERLLRTVGYGPYPRALWEATPGLLSIADGGDPAAVRIVVRFAEGVGAYVVAGLRRCGLSGRTVDVVLSGGLLRGKCELLRRVLEGVVRPVCAGARFVDARYEPVVGAALLALEKVRGAGLDASVRRATESTSRGLGLVRMDGV